MRSYITVIAVVLSFLMMTTLYSRYKAQAGPIPPGVLLAGRDFTAVKDPAQIEAELARAYSEPIAVFIAEQRLILRPDELDFQLDVPRMVAEAGQFLQGDAFIEIALRAGLGFPPRPRPLPLRYTYDQAKLQTWLEAAAATYNRRPQPARVIPPAQTLRDRVYAELAGADAAVAEQEGSRQDWQWMAGSGGFTVDVARSLPLVEAALATPGARSAHLARDESPVPPLSMVELAQALDQYLADFPGLGAVYVQDLIDGDEAKVDVDVAFSGMSTLKIFIVAAIFARMEGLENSEVGQWMDYALGESSNFAANLMLRWLGSGDTNTGARAVTDFARALGMENTYMQTGFDDRSRLPPIPTPGNQRTDWNTDPDTHLQSTPADMGHLLAAIYRCTAGEGLLIESFPEQITPEECGHMLFYLSHDEFQEMIWAGLPEPAATWIVHKHGFAFESHSDVALVWGPAGPYVISIFLYRPRWLDWSTSNGTIQDLSRITWRFFELKQQIEARTVPAPPTLEPPPNYLPIVVQ